MSAEFPVISKIVSPAKCNEKPWDLWVSEIGHISPLRDEEAAFATPASADGKPPAVPMRRRPRRSRLRADAMSLHAQFPQLDALDAAVCQLCGGVLKCSAALRHLRDSHAAADSLLPPPPAPTLKLKTASRSRHKKEPAPPPIPVELPPVPLPVPVEPPPVAAAARLPAPDLQYVEDPPTDLQVCGDLPVVSIQDTDDLPLGENITDDIFAIMNSEGIESADDITNAADWKNIIRDIGNMGDLNFSQPTDGTAASDLYPPVDSAALSALALSDADLAALALPPPARPSPAPPTLLAPPARAKPPKAKLPLREYDPNKHCGVVTAENKPCTRSLTCKAHALSLRRTVEGRAKPFDTLLAEHRAARDAPPPPEPPPPAPAESLPEPVPVVDGPAAAELYWYGGAPRPLALCTFNACATGGAVTLGKRFATVRSSIKSALSRGGGSGGGWAAGGRRAGARPELRRLLAAPRRDARLNGHVDHKASAKRAPLLGLAFALDPLLADDKC